MVARWGRPAVAAIAGLLLAQCHSPGQRQQQERDRRSTDIATNGSASDIGQAAHCLAVLDAAALQKRGPFRKHVHELGLDDLNPGVRRRWLERGRQAIRGEDADTGASSPALREPLPHIATVEDLERLADQSFDCAAEVSSYGPQERWDP